MFEPLNTAKLSSDEFARIIGVNRTSVFNWRAGRSKPHSMLEDRVNRALALIATLVEKGKLPLSDDLDSEQRKAKVDAVRRIFLDRCPQHAYA